ncbi:response regulator receiver domain [alpha proteobacterium BAL199]|jgi:DNA-binding response OmpR family regulator|nr:response regulator receiver domain [alpha proteobacterium BAL199]
MKISLVDDDDGLRDALQEVLQRAGHEVRAASNGIKAAQLLREWSADLVVCDMLMPDSEGFEVLRSVRRNTPDMKFIMMSGASGELSQFLNQAPLLGADAILQKPFAPNDLLEMIDGLVTGKTASSASNKTSE